MNYDLFVSKAATIGGGFFMGMLIGYFVRKILKLVIFALGGVFSLLVYLQYQGPGHGFINQTKEFTDGYVLGFCSVAGSDASMDEDEATFWCSDGPSRYKAISHTE